MSVPTAPPAVAAPGAPIRREGPTVAYLAFLGIVMAVGVDIALPAFDAIRESFGMSANSSTVSLVGTTYFLGMALGQLIIGPAADRFGRNACLRVTIAVSVLGAIGASFAPSFVVLLAARFVWGMGSAGPAVLRTAIARDLFAGDQMARVVSKIMAVFLLGPIFVPSIGQLVLDNSSWRGVFVTAVVVGAVAFGWTVAFGETLPVEHRRAFDPASLLAGAREVFANRPTVAFICAQTFTTGAFFIFLGSSQPVMEHLYDRGDEFARYFGLAGIIMALSLIASQRAIGRFGARQVIAPMLVGTATLSCVGLAVAVAAGGVPSFWVWFVWIATTNATLIVVTPMCNALALEPMGALAGTASALLGFVTLAGGAIAASVFDRLITDSVTPMIAGYLAFSLSALGCVTWALRRG